MPLTGLIPRRSIAFLIPVFLSEVLTTDIFVFVVFADGEDEGSEEALEDEAASPSLPPCH